MSKDYLRNAYHGMYARCYNTSNPSYKHYGARGISIYSPWLVNKNTFFEWVKNSIGERPSDDYSLDRINNDGNYEPGNLRWATVKEQVSNRRNNRFVMFNGEKVTQSECARRVGLSHQRIQQLRKSGNARGIEFL